MWIIGDSTCVKTTRTLNGKHIKINDAFLYEAITGKKTTTHEIGHTGGLSHPSFDPSQLMQIPSQNFMKQGELSHPTGPTKEQIIRIFNLYTKGTLNNEKVNPIGASTIPYTD